MCIAIAHARWIYICGVVRVWLHETNSNQINNRRLTEIRTENRELDCKKVFEHPKNPPGYATDITCAFIASAIHVIFCNVRC